MAANNIYRLEHRTSTLGPFEHHSSRVKHINRKQHALRYIRSCATAFMPDIDPDVRDEIMKNPKHRYGWSSLEKFSQMLIDREKLDKLGFRLVIYSVTEDCVHQEFPCGQVAYVPVPSAPKRVFRLTDPNLGLL